MPCCVVSCRVVLWFMAAFTAVCTAHAATRVADSDLVVGWKTLELPSGLATSHTSGDTSASTETAEVTQPETLTAAPITAVQMIVAPPTALLAVVQAAVAAQAAVLPAARHHPPPTHRRRRPVRPTVCHREVGTPAAHLHAPSAAPTAPMPLALEAGRHSGSSSHVGHPGRRVSVSTASRGRPGVGCPAARLLRAGSVGRSVGHHRDGAARPLVAWTWAVALGRWAVGFEALQPVRARRCVGVWQCWRSVG